MQPTFHIYKSYFESLIVEDLRTLDSNGNTFQHYFIRSWLNKFTLLNKQFNTVDTKYK